MKNCFTTILNSIIQLVFQLRRYIRKRKLARINKSIVVHSYPITNGDDEYNKYCYALSFDCKKLSTNGIRIILHLIDSMLEEKDDDAIRKISWDAKRIIVYTPLDMWNEWVSYLKERLGE